MHGMAHDVTSKSARIQAAAPGPLPRLRRDEAQGWIAGKASSIVATRKSGQWYRWELVDRGSRFKLLIVLIY